MKVAIVTGANSGVGLALCNHLLNTHESLHLCLLCRNESRAETARHDLVLSHPGAQVSVVLCDVGQPSCVIEAAEQIRRRFDRIDFLYLNAGIMPRTSLGWSVIFTNLLNMKVLYHVLATGDGLLLQTDTRRTDGLMDIFATNVLGHFILYIEVEALVKKVDGRVIWTSSRNAVSDAYSIDDLQHANGNRGYSSSKYVIDLLSYHIHKNKGVTSAVACPGLVLTNLAYGILPELVWYLIYPLVVLLRLFSGTFTLSPNKGAESLLYLSSIEREQIDPEVKYCTVRDVFGRTHVQPKKEFDKYAELVKKLKTKPTDDEMLTLYGLFKQVKFGDNTTAQPGFLDFTGKAKWKAWDGRKGMSTDDAAKQYVDFAKDLIDKNGLQE